MRNSNNSDPIGTDKKLIVAAAALLNAGGESAVTLRAIGSAAGVSHNALTSTSKVEAHCWRRYALSGMRFLDAVPLASVTLGAAGGR